MALETVLLLVVDLEEAVEVHAGGLSSGGHAEEGVGLDLLELVLDLLDVVDEAVE